MDERYPNIIRVEGLVVCLLYESYTHTRALQNPRVATPTLTIKLAAPPPVAPEYERAHFIGHALYNPALTRESLLGHAAALETEIENRTGYAAFLVDIKIKHYAPVMTDVDFIIDVPTEKVFSPIATITIIAIIAVCAAVFAFIVWLFWTTYIEKVKLYVCDQEEPPMMFEGWLQYVAHLKEKHPTKYDAIMEAEAKDWWRAIPELVKWIVAGAVAVTIGGVIIEVARRSR